MTTQIPDLIATAFTAAELGDKSWFVTNAARLRRQLRYNPEYNLIRAAAKAGHCDIVDWISRELNQSLDITSRDSDIFRDAAMTGHLKLIQWMINNSASDHELTTELHWAIFFATTSGHLDIIRWIVKDSGRPVNLATADNFIARTAAENNHLDILKWLVKDSGQMIDVTDNDNMIFRSAVNIGQLEILQWLIEESGQPVDVQILNLSDFHQALRQGDLSVFQWLLSVAHHIPKNEICGYDILTTLINTEQAETLTWLIDSSQSPLTLQQLMRVASYLQLANELQTSVSKTRTAQAVHDAVCVIQEIGLEEYRRAREPKRQLTLTQQI